MGIESDQSIIYIRPANHLLAIDPREYWRSRYMFQMLVWRKVRASFGEMHLWFLWVCARPLIYVLIFSLFKKWSEARTGVSMPYVLYIYSGLILWYYFMETAIDVSKNIRSNAGLLSKIYIPRLLTPTVPLFSNLFDLGVAMIPLLAMMIYFGTYPSASILLLVPTLLAIMLLAMGLGLLIAAATLYLPDLQKFLEFSLYMGMFASPVIFSPKMIPPEYHTVYSLNPLVGVLMGWRSSLFGQPEFPWAAWVYSVMAAFAVFYVGFYAYRKYEHQLLESL